ncbi:hypothetical protein NQ314_009160 [Rhamnusium bicolor]|uniref:Protein SZT2 n=1 Tax=Rhamnusium bicolor TaxID=1586634 RepID=A0AAV8Y402_9CUCU|nr:hypothetical protein NQ314_009160 [Rhamnusium bicolor]
MEFDSQSQCSDEGVELSISENGEIFSGDYPYVEDSQPSFLEAKTVYLLMQRNVPVSRASRLQWLLDHLNTTITTPSKKLNESSNNLEVIAAIPREQNLTKCNRYLVTYRTEIKFLSHNYRFVYCLDMSPSQANVDIQKGEILFDEILNCFKASMDGLCRQFTIPGNSLVFQPCIYLTVIVNTPFFMSPAQQVLVKGVQVTPSNISEIIDYVEKHFHLLEGKIADAAAVALDQIEIQKIHNEGLVGSLFDLPESQKLFSKIPMVSPDVNFVNINETFCSHKLPSIVSKRQTDENTSASILLLLSRRMREGFTVDNIFLYERQAIIERFWLRLSQLSSGDVGLAQQLSSFQINKDWYTLPESVRNGIPVYALNNTNCSDATRLILTPRYERIPNNFTTVIFPDGTQPPHSTLNLPSPVTGSLFTTLSRYLYHKRWIWSATHPINPKLPDQSISRILNTLTRMRIREGFSFAHSSSGIITMVLELWMEPNATCVIQYVLFPPHCAWLSEDMYSGSDEENEQSPEIEAEMQIVTEVWIEPQYGRVIPSNPRINYMDNKHYYEIADVWYPIVTPRIEHIPFNFNPISILPICQETELLFSMFIEAKEKLFLPECNVDKANRLLLDNILEHLSLLHDRELELTKDESDRFTQGSEENVTSQWRCFIKGISVTHVILTFVASTIDDLKSLTSLDHTNIPSLNESVDSIERTSSRESNYSDVPMNTPNSVCLPIYVFDCPLGVLSSEDLKEESETLEYSCVKQHCKTLVLAHSKCFTISLFIALHMGQYVHSHDVQSAMDQCEESVTEIDITEYIMTICGHAKQQSSDKIPIKELHQAFPCSELKSLHMLIKEKFFKMIGTCFNPIPTSSEFYFYKNLKNLHYIEDILNDSDDEISNTASEVVEFKSDKEFSIFSEGPHLFQRMESGIGDMVNSSEVNPLFLHLICTLRYNNGEVSNTSLRVLPTCLGELIQNLGASTEILEPLRYLTDIQKKSIILLREEIKWLLQDEICTSLLDVDPITSDTLNFIMKHVNEGNPVRSSCVLDIIDLNFVFASIQSHERFVQEFSKLKLPYSGYKLCKEVDLYYLAKDDVPVRDRKESGCLLDNVEKNNLQHSNIPTSLHNGFNNNELDYNIKEFFNCVEGNVNYQNNFQDDVNSQQSDISSTNGSAVGTDGGYDEDVSEDYEDYEWIISLSNKRKLLPNFWLIMKVDQEVVTIYFHCSAVCEAVRGLCKKVNQLLLLQSLYETKTCDQLLEPDDNCRNDVCNSPISRNVTYCRLRGMDENSDESELMAYSTSLSEASLNFTAGYFSCPIVWETHFVLHSRLKTGPGKSGISRGILALKNILDNFSVSNRNNMFVYRDNQKNVFYLRLHENVHCPNTKGALLRPSEYEHATVSRSPSIASLPLGQNKSNLAQSEQSITSVISGDIRPRVRSFGEKESKDTPNEDTLILKVHGITSAGTDVQHDLVQVLQNRLDDAVLEFLSVMLARNSMCPLTPEDSQNPSSGSRGIACIALAVINNCEKPPPENESINFDKTFKTKDFKYTVSSEILKLSDDCPNCYLEFRLWKQGRVNIENLSQKLKSAVSQATWDIVTEYYLLKKPLCVENVSSNYLAKIGPVRMNSLNIDFSKEIEFNCVLELNTDRNVKESISNTGKRKLEHFLPRNKRNRRFIQPNPKTTRSITFDDCDKKKDTVTQRSQPLKPMIKLNSLETGDAGMLSDVYSKYLPNWLEFGFSLSTPSVKKHRINLANRHLPNIVIQELLNILQDCPKAFSSIPTHCLKSKSEDIFVPYIASNLIQRFVIISRNFDQWLATITMEGSAEYPDNISPHALKHSQKFVPTLWNNTFIPRQKMLWISAESDNHSHKRIQPTYNIPAILEAFRDSFRIAKYSSTDPVVTFTLEMREMKTLEQKSRGKGLVTQMWENSLTNLTLTFFLTEELKTLHAMYQSRTIEFNEPFFITKLHAIECNRLQNISSRASINRYNFKVFKMDVWEGDSEYILVQVTSTPQVYVYRDSQDRHHTDDFDITLVVYNLCTPFSPSDNVLHLKYYLILTSKREIYPKSEIENKLGKFRTVSSTARSISALENTSNESETSMEKTEHSEGDCDTSSDEHITFSQQSSTIPYIEIYQESVNYLGYYSSHEQLMQQLILDKANMTQKHIKDMVAKGMIHCRTHLLWNRLISPQESQILSYDEFMELKGLAKLEHLCHMHPNLGPLLNQPLSWYQGLAKLLLVKYVDQYRSFISSDGNIQHYVILHPRYFGAFMLLSMDLHTSRGVNK